MEAQEGGSTASQERGLRTDSGKMKMRRASRNTKPMATAVQAELIRVLGTVLPVGLAGPGVWAGAPLAGAPPPGRSGCVAGGFRSLNLIGIATLRVVATSKAYAIGSYRPQARPAVSKVVIRPSSPPPGPPNAITLVHEKEAHGGHLCWDDQLPPPCSARTALPTLARLFRPWPNEDGRRERTDRCPSAIGSWAQIGSADTPMRPVH